MLDKGGVAQAPPLAKSKKVKVNSDDEIEGEMIEGDVHFDTSLDEGIKSYYTIILNKL